MDEKTKQFMIRLTEEEHRKVKELQSRGCNISQLFRNQVNEKYEDIMKDFWK